MKFIFTELVDMNIQQGPEMEGILKSVLNSHLPLLEKDFVQDLSHISQAAKYVGGMVVESVHYLKDNIYRCDYRYDWEIAWTCAGSQEVGRVNEKLRFTLNTEGVIEFKFLKLSH